MRYLSWDEFNSCVESISSLCRDKRFSGVYGFPRGGLCLAVALSHSLEIPFFDQPQQGSLIIDDIYETGKTLNSAREIPDSSTFVWLSKVQPIWWTAFEVVTSDEWFVFPWENRVLAQKDQQAYLKSRN